MCKECDKITLKKVQLWHTNYDLIVYKPIKLYVQVLITDTENAARNFSTKILIAVARKNISQIENSNTLNILHKSSNKTNS
jgi:hypothetical protein